MKLTAEEVHKMKVVELRAELTARGLDTKGVKAVLAERLIAALDTDPSAATGLGNGNSSVQDVEASGEAENNAEVKGPDDESSTGQGEETPLTAEEEEKLLEGNGDDEAPGDEETEEEKEEEQGDEETQEGDEEQVGEEQGDGVGQEGDEEGPEGDEADKDEAEKAEVDKADVDKGEVDKAEAADESMDVDQESNKRKIDDVQAEDDEGKEKPEKKRQRTEEVKVIPEHEPEIDEDKVMLDWCKLLKLYHGLLYLGCIFYHSIIPYVLQTSQI